jgi:hypothetical protein
VLFLLLLAASALLLTIPGLRLLKRGTIGRPKVRDGCWRCGFSLAGLPGAVGCCPECGSPVVALGHRPPTPAKERLLLLAIAGLCLVPGLHSTVILGQVLTQSSVFASLSPSTVLSRASRAGVQNWQIYNAAGTQAQSFAQGSLGEKPLRSALDRMALELENKGTAFLGMPYPTQSESRRIDSQFGGEGLAKVAAALDDRSLPSDRLDVLLDALAHAYETHAVAHSTDIDHVVCGMLGGAWPDRHSSSSGEYKPTLPSPRDLTPAQRARLVKMVLTVQQAPDHPWNPAWGQALERAAASGAVDPGDMRRYLEQSFAPRIILDEGTTVRQGDVLRFRIDPGWVTGSPIPLFVKVRAASPSFAGRVQGGVCVGTITNPDMNSNQQYDAYLFLPDTTGPVRLELEVAVSFGGDCIDALKGWINPWGYETQEPAWRKLPAVTVVKKASIDLQLVASDSPRTREEATGSDEVAAGLSATCWYCGTTDNAVYEVSVSPASADLAAEVFLRQDTVERRLGWAFSYRIGWQGLRLAGTAAGIDPTRPVDVVVRSSLGPVERSYWAPTVWKGEAVISKVRPRQRMLPAEMGR